MPRYTIEKDVLRVVGSDTPIHFPQTISDVLEYPNRLVVRLDWSVDNTRNVYAVDSTGRIVWRIPEVSPGPQKDIYFSVEKISDDVVRAVSSMGVTVDFDVRTGTMITSYLTK